MRKQVPMAEDTPVVDTLAAITAIGGSSHTAQRTPPATEGRLNNPRLDGAAEP
jgi:hypothetical protein